ncbi:MAG TPA: hypothetical protein VEA40_02065, partial [Ramlibacter sp.]|nr:hypothetical protein [Ramlibacter sp.]
MTDSIARYYIPVNHFTEPRPQAQPHAFEAERQQVFGSEARGPTRRVLLDLSPGLALPFAATTHTMLASYLVVRAGESLELDLRCLSSLAWVIDGQGRAEVDGRVLEWQPGELLSLPGDTPARFTATRDAILFHACDSPLCRYLSMAPRLDGETRQPVHYTADAIAQRMRE